MSSNIITGIDIGTSSIKAVSAVKNAEKRFDILSKVSRPVFGVRKGIVVNTEGVTAAISDCIKEMEIQTDRKIDEVYININGSHITSSISKGLVSVSRADQKISLEDIDRVIQAAKTPPMSKNREIIDVIPQKYIIDGVDGIKDPLEMQGIRLEAEVLLIEAFSQYIKTSTQAVVDAGVQVNDVIPGMISAARAVLNPKEKERGVAMIDIGTDTTSLAVFEEGTLLHVSVFPIGSRDITNDIAIGLKIDIDTAERIKIEFGSCLSKNKGKKKITSDSGEIIFFTSALLGKIIDARVSEILDLVEADLKKLSKNKMLPSGIVVTGGGAMLSGMSDIVKKELSLSCRIGSPNEFNPGIEDPRFAVACGLVLAGDEIEAEKETGLSGGIMKKIKRFLKRLMP